MTGTPYAKSDPIWWFPAPTFPIHYDTLAGSEEDLQVFTGETDECLLMRKFRVKSFVGKSITSKFSKMSLEGPDSQTALNIPTGLDNFVGAIDPRPTVSVNSCQAQPFPRNLESKKNFGAT